VGVLSKQLESNEDYTLKMGNGIDALRWPTKKKIAELMQAHGEDWYLAFLEPETRARKELGK